VLELPIESELLSRPDETLPNALYSSDHIALLAEFQYHTPPGSAAAARA
jgi:hypothetical protein